jgi:hypothetical protein
MTHGPRSPREGCNVPEEDVGAGHADVLEAMIVKFGQASSSPTLLDSPQPVPEHHGSQAECDKKDCTTECDTP